MLAIWAKKVGNCICEHTVKRSLVLPLANSQVDLGIIAISLAMMCVALNCSVLAYDYSGYGLSTGRLREKNLYADIEAAIEALKSQSVPMPLLLFFHAVCPT